MRKDHPLVVVLILITLGNWLVGCQHFSGHDKIEEFIKTRVEIIKSKIDNHDIMGAQMDLTPLLREFPDRAELHTLSGFINMTLGNHQRAIEKMIDAHELEPSPGSYLNLSSAYIASKQFGKARELIKQGIRLGKEENFIHLGRFYHNLGYVDEITGKHKRAIEQYKTALYHIPGYILTLDRLTRLLERIDRHD
ncbi:MAG: hypothetical protein OXC40_06875, partial [Proteobacteria bacterium]|nr:hypothetical protein [Pseudomonadota bacterium]